MKYQEFSTDQHREIAKSELRQYEMQHAQAVGNEAKFVALLAAHERGEFKSWNRDVVAQRVKEWAIQRDNERINIHVNELMIAGAQATLAGLPEAPAKDEGE